MEDDDRKSESERRNNCRELAQSAIYNADSALDYTEASTKYLRAIALALYAKAFLE